VARGAGAVALVRLELLAPLVAFRLLSGRISLRLNLIEQIRVNLKLTAVVERESLFLIDFQRVEVVGKFNARFS
jgi:hypothetical protein